MYILHMLGDFYETWQGSYDVGGDADVTYVESHLSHIPTWRQPVNVESSKVIELILYSNTSAISDVGK